MFLPLIVWEAAWWGVRRFKRSSAFERAVARAAELGRPLVVIGDPEGGVTSGYGCGDLTVDLSGAPTCARGVAADICVPNAIPLEDDSAVVFVSCVLEYVDDHDAAIAEVLRVAGSPDNIFVVRVEPWTLTSMLYPGSKRIVSPDGLSSNPLCTPLPRIAT